MSSHNGFTKWILACYFFKIIWTSRTELKYNTCADQIPFCGKHYFISDMCCSVTFCNCLSIFDYDFVFLISNEKFFIYNVYVWQKRPYNVATRVIFFQFWFFRVFHMTWKNIFTITMVERNGPIMSQRGQSSFNLQFQFFRVFHWKRKKIFAITPFKRKGPIMSQRVWNSFYFQFQFLWVFHMKWKNVFIYNDCTWEKRSNNVATGMKTLREKTQ